MHSNGLLGGAALLLFAANAHAGEFGGFYVGVDGGANLSTATSQVDKKSAFAGAVTGYDWELRRYLVGINGFYDAHGQAYTGKDAGLDFRLGLPLASWLPYVKLGVAGTSPGTRVHAGIGVEYKLVANWSVNGEWTADSKSSGPVTYNNNNFVIGISYHFGGNNQRAAPQAVAAPLVGGEPVVTKALVPETADRQSPPGSGQPAGAPREDGAAQPSGVDAAD